MTRSDHHTRTHPCRTTAEIMHGEAPKSRQSVTANSRRIGFKGQLHGLDVQVVSINRPLGAQPAGLPKRLRNGAR
jgi:hypothetical protein